MFIFLVKHTIYQFDASEVLFYKTTAGIETPVTITGGFLGDIEDLLNAIQNEHGIVFSGLYNMEFMTITLPAGIDSIDFKDLELGGWLGFKKYELIATKWGTHRFMIENESYLGHEALPLRPYEIESNFTLSGQVYKSVPKISTIFYDAIFADYSKSEIELGVIPFVENLESNTDMMMSSEAFSYFGGFFNSTLFQLNFAGKYLEVGGVLNSSKVKVQISERPSAENGGKILAFLTNSLGHYIIKTNGDFIIKEM